MMKIQPYLFFNGRCEEAADFYRATLGAEVLMAMRFSDMPAGGGQPQPDPAMSDKIMHMAIRIGDTEFMASDGRCTGDTNFQGFALNLQLDDAAAVKAFAALSEGGQVVMPLGPTFFAKNFGMVADRFGVTWMIHVPA
jgi:PhnB protein